MEHTMIPLRRRRSQTDKNIRTWVKVSKLRAAYNKLRGSDQQPEMGRCDGKSNLSNSNQDDRRAPAA
jgi:hypothetical protein